MMSDLRTQDGPASVEEDLQHCKSQSSLSPPGVRWCLMIRTFADLGHIRGGMADIVRETRLVRHESTFVNVLS
jgi:hypothetical protein